jgi:hypothetical protein
MGVACSSNGEMRNAYKILVGKFEGEGPLGIHEQRYGDNIKMGLPEIGFGVIDLIHVTQNRHR